MAGTLARSAFRLGRQLLAQAFGAGAQFFVGDHVEHRQRRGDRQRVGRIGAAQAAGRGRVHDLGAAAHRRQRHAAGQALGQRHQVGHDAVVLHREHLAGAGEAGLDLVGDQHDAVLVADLAQRHA